MTADLERRITGSKRTPALAHTKIVATIGPASEDRIGALHMQTLGILDNRARLVDQLGALGALAGAGGGDVKKLLGE